MKNPNRPKIRKMWESIDNQNLKPLTKTEGYKWGLAYLENAKKELLKLEKNALERNDPYFYNDVRESMLRAKEAENEILTKIRMS